MKRKYEVLISIIFLSLIFFLLGVVPFFHFYGENLIFSWVFSTGVLPYDLIMILLMTTLIMIPGFAISQKIIKIVEKDLKRNFDPGIVSAITCQSKTPLIETAGFFELLNDKNISTESQELYIQNIKTNSNYSLSIINDIPEFPENKRSRLTGFNSKCNINKIMAELLYDFNIRKVEIGKHDVSIIYKQGVNDNNFIIHTDTERLKQIIYNLLENALSYTNKGKIKFGYKLTDDGFIEFFVINPDQYKPLENEEQFFSQNKQREIQYLPYKGENLRLAISKSLVEIIGGKIRTESEHGKYSAIFFTIPQR